MLNGGITFRLSVTFPSTLERRLESDASCKYTDYRVAKKVSHHRFVNESY